MVRQRLTLPKAQKTAFDHSLECHPAIMVMMMMMMMMVGSENYYDEGENTKWHR